METIDGTGGGAGARASASARLHSRGASGSGRGADSGRGTGVALMLTAAASNQSGAALGAMAFPVLGPVGVVAVRQVAAAIILTAIVRPRMRGLSRQQWRPILGLALVFSVMNLSLYAAIERIGLGLAVTLEFLGPLVVAVVTSRRALDIGAAVVAGIGVVVLTQPGPTTDVLGIALALLAAVAWGCYILLNRTLGQRLPGLRGTAAAGLVSAVVWVPVGAIWFVLHPPTPAAIALAIGCAALASVVPYIADLLALRRVPAHVYGTFASVNPVLAAIAGWLLLQQALGLGQWIGIALIVLSNVVVSVRPGRAAARAPMAT